MTGIETHKRSLVTAASGQLQEAESDPLVSMVFVTDVVSKFRIVNGGYLASNYKFSISAMGT
jgi:predicted secreted protein